MAGFNIWCWIFVCLTVLSYARLGMAWTGEINGRVFCDVCADGSVGPEDHFLEGAEVAVLCMTISGEVLNYQAFTNSKGIFTVAETMSESNRWDMCLARAIGSIHQDCNILGNANSATKFSYTLSSGHSYTVRPFSYQPVKTPMYCL
uniref:Pollen Ole e 1 allergen and extensin family protein n=1 Tax=Araucaria cunninghamii TaxID=56994 RepID=A0A0D6RAR5_ARACU